MSASAGESFPRLVELACHDLRTPLATVSGFAKTLVRAGELGELRERDAKFVGMMDEAAGQMSDLLEQLGLAARIASGRYEPVPLEADTLELAAGSGDARVAAEGTGAVVETDPLVAGRALAALALATLRFGELESVTWAVSGRELTLSPVPSAAAQVLDGTASRDLGVLVARMAFDVLGATLAVGDDGLRVNL